MINHNTNNNIAFDINLKHRDHSDALFDNFLTAQPQAVPSASSIYLINWQIPYETKFGESISIVGNTKELGNWKAESALKLTWSENNIWRGQALIDLNESSNVKHLLEYKYVLSDDKNKTIQWEDGQNRFYYFSQIRNEAVPKSECFCPVLDKENIEISRLNQITNNHYNNHHSHLNHHYNRNVQIQNIQNIDGVCCHEMVISDVWNKKTIIFRIKETPSESDQVLDCNCNEYSKGSKSNQITTHNPQVLSSAKVIEQNLNYDNIHFEQKSSNSFKSISAFSSTTSLSSGKLELDSENLSLGNNSNENLKEDQHASQITYYVTGNNKVLGGLRHPQKMTYYPERKCWELKVFVDRETEYIRYFYIKKDEENNFQWEKGSGRFIYMQPLNNPCSFNASAINSCTSSSIQSSHALSDAHFVELKNELLQSPVIRANQIQPSSNTLLEKDILNFNQLQNCSCCNQNLQSVNASNRMAGKMHVNPLKRGAFVSQNNEDQLDFSLSFDKIIDQLFIGPYVSSHESEIKQLKASGVDTVLSLQTDEDMQRRQVDKNHLKELYRKNGIEFYNVPIKDKSFKDFFFKCSGAVDKLYNLLKNPKRVVYMHCTGGISRAPQTAILYLALYKNYPLKKAIKYVCNKRESAFPDEELLHQVYNRIIENLSN